MLVLGDAHADDPENRDALLAAYRESDADLALQVGDLGHYDLPAPTYFVAGNNEEFDAVDAMRRGDASLPVDGHRPHLLASAAVEAEGLRVAGLSGTYAPTQYEKSRRELAGGRRRHFVRDDVERLAALDDVDVLLAHAAPHGLLSFGYDPGVEPMDRLLDALQPDLCLVGHFHRHAEMERSGTRVVALRPVWQGYYALDPETLTLDWTAWD